MIVPINGSSLWMLKSILKSRDVAQEMQQWKDMDNKRNFNVKRIYYGLMGLNHSAHWKKLFFDNDAKPRARFILWLACHDRLTTKDRLVKSGVITNDQCMLCRSSEILEH